jgi:hypothetical protein
LPRRAAALTTGAFAQGGGDPWDLKERIAYVVMMDGSMKQIKVSDKGMTMLMKNAKKLPRGTVILMSGGNLYMVNAGKMFDRAGNAMFGF